MNASLSSLTQAYRPTTVLDRGVAVPFTTPVLSGTRARVASRGGIEFIVPNPSGARGHYILPWSGVRELCRPTLHDVRLNGRLATLRALTPLIVRETARAVAAEGLAGRHAKAAALAVPEMQQRDVLITNFALLLALIAQVELPGESAVAPDRERGHGLEARARRAIARIAPRLGLPPEELAAQLEALAARFAVIGIGSSADVARLPRLLSCLRKLNAELQDWQHSDDSDVAAAAQVLAATAELTLTCAERTIAETRGLVANLPQLLAGWIAHPEAVAEPTGRPEWLLDGWERICLIWQDAEGPRAKRGALAEIATLLPMVPREAIEWGHLGAGFDPGRALRPIVSLSRDPRTGLSVVEEIARNERLRALEIGEGRVRVP